MSSDIEIALPEEFKPETNDRAFILIGGDFVKFVHLPSLMATLATEVPNLQIVFMPPDPGNIEAMMANGEVEPYCRNICPTPDEQIWPHPLKLLKIGGVAVRNTRLIRIRFSSSFPSQELFELNYPELILALS